MPRPAYHTAPCHCCYSQNCLDLPRIPAEEEERISTQGVASPSIVLVWETEGGQQHHHCIYSFLQTGPGTMKHALITLAFASLVSFPVLESRRSSSVRRHGRGKATDHLCGQERDTIASHLCSKRRAQGDQINVPDERDGDELAYSARDTNSGLYHTFSVVSDADYYCIQDYKCVQSAWREQKMTRKEQKQQTQQPHQKLQKQPGPTDAYSSLYQYYKQRPGPAWVSTDSFAAMSRAEKIEILMMYWINGLILFLSWAKYMTLLEMIGVF